MRDWRVFVESAGPAGEPHLQAISVQVPKRDGLQEAEEEREAIDKALIGLCPPEGFTPRIAYACYEPKMLHSLRRRAEYERGA